MTKWPRGRAIGLAVVALLVAAGMAFLATADLASGAPEPTVSIESGEMLEGGTDVTTLTAEDVTSPALCGFTIDIVYDPDVKTPTECVADPEDNFTVADCEPEYAADTVRVTGGLGTAVGVTGDIPLADITWTAVGSAGDSSDLDVQIVSFADCSLPPVEITPVADQDGVNTLAGGLTHTHGLTHARGLAHARGQPDAGRDLPARLPRHLQRQRPPRRRTGAGRHQH
jgi:hypothetical protein